MFIKNLIRKIINNKEYGKILGFMLILYIIRIDHIKKMLFEDKEIITISQVVLLLLAILGATLLSGTIIFIAISLGNMFYTRKNVPKVKGKEWSFGAGELKYLMLNRKKCKKCGTKMEKITDEEYKGIEREINMDGYVSDVETYEVKISYYCRECNIKYSLEELATETK